MDEQTFASRIANLDLSLFQIESQTSPNDRASFLAVQNAVRTAKQSYVYLECGSHLGGSLLPHMLDPHCRLAYSVDKRPASQSDERGVFAYPDNQTKRMVDGLAALLDRESMRKLRTYDLDASELTAREIAEQPDLVMIDAEHTVRAVFRDFLKLSSLCGPSTVYAFHDANLIFAGLQNIETFPQHSGVPFDSYILRDSVFVLATNDAREVMRAPGQRLGGNKEIYWRAVQADLMRMHHDIVRNALQTAPAWQSGVGTRRV